MIGLFDTFNPLPSDAPSGGMLANGMLAACPLLPHEIDALPRELAARLRATVAKAYAEGHEDGVEAFREEANSICENTESNAHEKALDEATDYVVALEPFITISSEGHIDVELLNAPQDDNFRNLFDAIGDNMLAAVEAFLYRMAEKRRAG